MIDPGVRLRRLRDAYTTTTRQFAATMQTPSSLLPSGFADLLPPLAWRERQLRYAILERFRRFGYEEVSPPLLEFEDSLLDKTSLDRQTFRVMDATSQRMMGFRADMTPQIARIAASRMQGEPLPLRLCYAGTCLRVKGEGLHKSRQLLQAGIECIGVDGDQTLIEVLRCAQETLAGIGVTDLTLDITLPGLVTSLLKSAPKEERGDVRRAIEQKDRHRIRQLEEPLGGTILALMDGATLESVEDRMQDLPAFAASWLEHVRAIKRALPELTITLDPLEESGFGYYDGIAFSIFSRSLGCEIGRGGRYIAHENLLAYGFTLYLNPMLRNSTLEDKATRCLILSGANEEAAKDLREKGWRTVYSTARTAAEAKQEAARFHCTKLLERDKVTDV